MKEMYITETTVKKPVNKSCYFCTYADHSFDSLEEIGNCEFCSNCGWSCDRKDFKFQQKHNLRGLVMKPFHKDPIVYRIMIDKPLTKTEKIKRILEDEK